MFSQKLSKSNAEALNFVFLQSNAKYSVSIASWKQSCDVPLKTVVFQSSPQKRCVNFI